MAKDPAAVRLGSKGGKKSAAVRLQRMTREQREDIGRRLAQARWEKWREENPAKAAETQVRREKRAVGDK
jgi:hypothetical protein